MIHCRRCCQLDHGRPVLVFDPPHARQVAASRMKPGHNISAAPLFAIRRRDRDARWRCLFVGSRRALRGRKTSRPWAITISIRDSARTITISSAGVTCRPQLLGKSDRADFEHEPRKETEQKKRLPGHKPGSRSLFSMKSVRRFRPPQRNPRLSPMEWTWRVERA